MKIAVVGGGPAGCRVSELLALAGHDVSLLDPHGPWEKPCGGGITAKSRDLDRLVPPQMARRAIDRMTIYFGDQLQVTVSTEDVAVVSRKDLALHAYAAAEAAGVEVIRDRVGHLERTATGWTVDAKARSLAADFVIGADGATSFVRRTVAEPLSGEDLHVTVGYFIPGETDSRMKVFFLPELEGYVWSFPRPDHLSYGLITRADPNWTARAKAILRNYIQADLGTEAMEQAAFYSAPVPALSPDSWTRNRISGDRWALVGDAAGLVDPITGEGIYYALRSAEVLAESFPDLPAYAATMNEECVAELQRSARLYSQFYRGRFFGASFRKRMVQFAGRSERVRLILESLIAGRQPYTGLRRRLLKSAPKIALELARSAGRGRENGKQD
jgi:geranylgeranyl reductase family protein